MKIEDIRSLSKEELSQKCGDLQKELFALRVQIKMGQSKDSAKLNSLKKSIAKIKQFKVWRAPVNSSRKVKEGVVVSNKMQKTVVVSEERKVMHPIYKKRVKKTKKFKAHSEAPLLIGDVVKIEETRPLSKEKRWRVIKVVKKAVMEG